MPNMYSCQSTWSVLGVWHNVAAAAPALLPPPSPVPPRQTTGWIAICWTFWFTCPMSVLTWLLRCCISVLISRSSLLNVWFQAYKACIWSAMSVGLFPPPAPSAIPLTSSNLNSSMCTLFSWLEMTRHTFLLDSDPLVGCRSLHMLYRYVFVGAPASNPPC